ncbi:unnamed protein product [Caenorhabditis angaria]|uniref:DUF38 domain-containing protein n=1 Tax=Caenorhabditis angaria TaxID=860376 RepID=A0A9P1IER2_9PELO|nr:unnamed protein product [Caenorhabditis angaria]
MKFYLLLLIPVFCHAIDKLSEDEARAVALSLIEDNFLIPLDQFELSTLNRIPFYYSFCNETGRYLDEVELFEMILKDRKSLEDQYNKPGSLLLDEILRHRDDSIRHRIMNRDLDEHIRFSEEQLTRLREIIREIYFDDDSLNFHALTHFGNNPVIYQVVHEMGRFLLASEVWVDCAAL